ncbi:MAG TPA: response regulator [Candidatus Methylomirabilis sp.]|nr:response regulator [Candidatus Methylomirabilis sp.]
MGIGRQTTSLGGNGKSGQEGKAPGRRILLVDDKPFSLALRQSLLRSGVSQVLLAASGAEGLRVARTTQPDAILLDAELPDLDGFEVCRRLRVDPLTEVIPVILLTGSSRPPSDRSTHEAGAVASLPMSIETPRLLNMIQMILTTPMTRRAFPRASVRRAVIYEHAGRTGTGETLNLSQGGMFILTPSPLEVGTHLVLRFALSISEPWQATARVVWIRRAEEEHPYPVGMAVQFFELPPEARSAIATFVANLLAAPTPSREA